MSRLSKGDFIRIGGVEGWWRVGTLVGNRLYLTPCNEDGTENAFNAATGRYWIDLPDGHLSKQGIVQPVSN